MAVWRSEGEKGRSTLQGLDRTLGLVAFDWVQENGPQPLLVTADGMLRFDLAPNLANDGLEWDRRMPNGKGIRCRGTQEERPNRNKIPCPWVRLSYCPQWIRDELANRWTVRYVAVQQRKQGAEAAYHWTTHQVFPFDVVISWFRFIWPEEKEWLGRAMKYLTGFSEAYVQKLPGVGATIKVTKSKWPDLMEPGTYRMGTFSLGGYPRLETAKNLYTIVPNSGDEWEVID